MQTTRRHCARRPAVRFRLRTHGVVLVMGVAAAILAVTALLPARATPRARAAPVPSTPTVLALEATTSTTVAGGGSVTVAFDFANVLPHPGLTLEYTTSGGATTTTSLDVFTSQITVPASWKPGAYHLQSVTLTNIDNSSGVHYRNHDYVGTDGSGSTTLGKDNLQLSRLDLKVLAS